MRFHFWYTALSLFYALLAVLAYVWLSGSGKLVSFVPVGDFFLMTLATMRLVRLFTYDRITAFMRKWFENAEPESFRHTVGELLDCPWCTGLWFALVMAFFYFALPVITWYTMLVLALASAATFMQLCANYVGWSAEARKLECSAPILPR